MSSDKELIKHAAVKATNGWVFIGKHHGDCFHKLQGVGLKAVKDRREGQGFVTSKGRYVDRCEAARIAFTSDQIECCTNSLFSEHLWDKGMYEGKHEYSEVKGYFLKEE